MQHNDLNSHNLEKYLKYIEIDLNGSFPEFHPKGYLILQSAILNDIYNAILKHLRRYKEYCNKFYN